MMRMRAISLTSLNLVPLWHVLCCLSTLSPEIFTGSYILGVKEGDHAFLFEHVAAAERAGRVTYYDREEPETGLCHRFRFVSDVPLNESHADLRVNFLECWEWDGDTVQH